MRKRRQKPLLLFHFSCAASLTPQAGIIEHRAGRVQKSNTDQRLRPTLSGLGPLRESSGPRNTAASLAGPSPASGLAIGSTPRRGPEEPPTDLPTRHWRRPDPHASICHQVSDFAFGVPFQPESVALLPLPQRRNARDHSIPAVCHLPPADHKLRGLTRSVAESYRPAHETTSLRPASDHPRRL